MLSEEKNQAKKGAQEPRAANTGHNDVIGQEAWGFDNPLTVAVWFGYDDVVRELTHDHDLLDEFGGHALYLAASMGRLEEMSLLLDAGVSPNAEEDDGLTPIYGAAEHGCVQAMQMLLDAGANLNHRARSRWLLLKFTVFANQFDAARFLIARGYSADDEERRKVQELLHQKGLDPNSSSSSANQFGPKGTATDGVRFTS